MAVIGGLEFVSAPIVPIREMRVAGGGSDPELGCPSLVRGSGRTRESGLAGLGKMCLR